MRSEEESSRLVLGRGRGPLCQGECPGMACGPLQVFFCFFA